MKNNEIKDLREKSKDTLNKLLNQTRQEIAKIMIERNSGKHKNTNLISQKKRDIARILTIIRQKEIKSL